MPVSNTPSIEERFNELSPTELLFILRQKPEDVPNHWDLASMQQAAEERLNQINAQGTTGMHFTAA